MEDPASPDRWQRVQRLFAEVVGLEPERREARLERACRDDPGLREAVLALLDQHVGGDGVGRSDKLECLPASPKRGMGPMPASAAEPQGELINGRYRLLEELGRGAMGVVYKAEDTKLDCFVTLKFLHPHLAADRKARTRFVKEARAASDLNHPNICLVKDHDEAEDGRLFLVMAYYGGKSLEEVIEQGPLPVKQAVDIARQIAAGLAAAHRPTEHRPEGIIHRDIKPSNVLITDEGTAIILDFGIAKMADSGLTGTGTILGTLAYMSPEHLQNGMVCKGTDLWALGVTLYEMLAGERPFREYYGAALHNAILNNDPLPLAKRRRHIPKALREVVYGCLEKDPEVRYQSAEEVEAKLKQVEEGGGLAWGAPQFFRRVRSAAQGRRKSLTMLALGTLTLALIFLSSPIRTEVAEWLDGAPDVQHLAVLPLLSTADEASIGEGLTLTLTSLLTQLGSHAEQPITVVPASEMRDITTVTDTRERFGVDVVVSGDFRQEGGQAQLTLNLIDAHTLQQLDTERLTKPANRLPALERHALITLADMLGVPLSGEREAMLSAGGTTSAEAYEFYAKGQAALDRSEKSENIDTAIELFQWALEEDSLYALAHAGLGEAYMLKYTSTRQAEWIDLARRQGTYALALEERLAPVRVMLGRLHDFTGAYDMAVREFNLALSLDEGQVSAHHGLGEAYRKLGRSSEAEAHFRQAIDLQPRHWRYHLDLGAFYQDEGRYDSAAAAFQQVIDLAQDNPQGYNNLGAIRLMQGRLTEARRLLEQSIALKPYYAAYTNLGAVYFAEGRPADEARMYERALALDSSDFRVWGNLAGAYERSGAGPEQVRSAYERARQGAADALRVNPNAAEVLAVLANYLTLLDRPDEARPYLIRALTLAPDDATVTYYAGVSYERMGERALALEWINRSIANGYPLQWVEEDGELEGLRRDPEFVRWLTQNEP